MHEADRMLHRLAPDLFTEILGTSHTLAPKEGEESHPRTTADSVEAVTLPVIYARAHALGIVLKRNLDLLPEAAALADNPASLRKVSAFLGSRWTSFMDLLTGRPSDSPREILLYALSAAMVCSHTESPGVQGPLFPNTRDLTPQQLPLLQWLRAQVSTVHQKPVLPSRSHFHRMAFFSRAWTSPGRRTLLAACAAVVTIFAAAWFFNPLIRDPHPGRTGLSSIAAIPLVIPPGVTVSRPSTTPFEPCNPVVSGNRCILLRPGDRIETDSRSKLTVHLGDFAAVALDPATRIRFVNFSDANIEIQAGRVAAKVDPGQHRSFLLGIPGGDSVRVTGTVFSVSYSRETSEADILVLQGSVDVSGPTGSNRPAKIPAGFGRRIKSNPTDLDRENRSLTSREQAELQNVAEIPLAFPANSSPGGRGFPGRNSPVPEGTTIRRFIEIKTRDGSIETLDSSHIESHHETADGFIEYQLPEGARTGKVVRHLREVRTADGQIHRVIEP